MNSEVSSPVVEIVTFRAAPGQTTATMMAAARATGPLVAAMPGFVARYLSLGDDGQWTDHIHWTSLAAAQHAAQAVMTDSAALPFLRAIDPDSIVMRHEVLHWQIAATLA